LSYFKDSKLNDCKLGHTRIFAEGNVAINSCELHGTIYVGFGSYINSGAIRGTTEIGRYCSIGRDVKIGLGSHNLSSISTSSFLEHLGNLKDAPDVRIQESPERHLIIGNDVWIGDNTLIKKGIRIGDGVIIGAGSIVTKDIPSFAIVVGTPAKIMRYRFDEETIEKLNRLKWWNINPKILHELPKGLSVKEYIEILDNVSEIYKKSYKVIYPIDIK
tara:strand:- start:4562 stop:5212 length:651 start_codon:yes stop_codon:yes gene_type:complete